MSSAVEVYWRNLVGLVGQQIATELVAILENLPSCEDTEKLQKILLNENIVRCDLLLKLSYPKETKS